MTDPDSDIGRLKWVILVLVAVAAFIGWVIQDARDTVSKAMPVAQGGLAILPLTPAQPDSALTHLGRTLTVTVSLNLAAVPQIPVVAAGRVLAAVPDSPLTVDAARDLTRNLGASGFMLGTLAATGIDSVRIDLGIYGVTERAIQRLIVYGSRQDLIALTDSLTWKLLTKLWQGHNPPSPSITAAASGSNEGLRAWADSIIRMSCPGCTR